MPAPNNTFEQTQLKHKTTYGWWVGVAYANRYPPNSLRIAGSALAHASNSCESLLQLQPLPAERTPAHG